ncbi:hypothetical protein GGR19_002313 [Croceicoccus naphthovorans]|nr:hypothetical protein [Croceicoccus naphthovorans]MBB3990882.1 hypothetical protein [Croceicoccus naphthovorans]
MLEPLAVDGLLTRAGVRVGGESVIEQQLELVVAAGAKRLLLLADRRAVGLDDAVALASEAGMEVRIIADAPALCSEVTAADELMVLGDALIADPVLLLPLLQTSGVAVLPIEAGLAAGFERIDAENAWAGVLVIPGALAERLRQLPRDCDVASSLLRIALMAGVTVRQVPGEALTEKRWAVVKSEADGLAIEAHRLRHSLEAARGRTLGSRLAGLLVGRFGNRLFEADRSPVLVWWFALVPVAAAVALAAFGMFASALIALGLAWLTVRGAIILQDAERQGRLASALPDHKPLVAHIALDLLLLLLLALALSGWDWGQSLDVLGPWFVATVWIAVTRIAAEGFPFAMARPWFEDRFSQCLVFAIAIAGGVLGPVAMLGGMAILLAWAGLTVVRADGVEN